MTAKSLFVQQPHEQFILRSFNFQHRETRGVWKYKSRKDLNQEIPHRQKCIRILLCVHFSNLQVWFLQKTSSIKLAWCRLDLANWVFLSKFVFLKCAVNTCEHESSPRSLIFRFRAPPKCVRIVKTQFLHFDPKQ